MVQNNVIKRKFTMNYHNLKSNNMQIKGFTLVEVLVSMIILAVGLLGASALIVHGLQTGQGASQRSVAVVIAQTLADKLRSNKEFATKGDNGHKDYYFSKLDVALGDGCEVDASGNPTSNALCDKCSSAGSDDCTVEDQAQKDMLDIFDMINSNMPGSRMVVERMSIRIPNSQDANNNIYCVAISWVEQGLGKKSATNKKSNVLVEENGKKICGDTGYELPEGHTSFYQTWVQL